MALKMKKEHFVKLMRFPKEWVEWNMYPDELFEIQLMDYRPGEEAGSEHFRYGAFQWWLRKGLTSDIIQKYLDLTYIDHDSLMGESARNDLDKLVNPMNVQDDEKQSKQA